MKKKTLQNEEKPATLPPSSILVETGILVHPHLCPRHILWITEYLKYIGSYEDNMGHLLKELKKLCSKKQDIDAQVMESKERLRVMTRETTNWMRNLQELIESEEMKMLLKDDRVAEIVVKMMEQRVMKKLLKEDREIFDIVVRVVKKKCNEGIGDVEAVDVEEDEDYKKVAKIASEVIKDTVEEFKKFMKRDDAAIAAVKLLNDVNLEKLKQDDKVMAKILSKAEGISRIEIEHNDHDEGELLLQKHDNSVQPTGKNIIKEKAGNLRKRLGSLMDFLNDENFKKELGDGARLGLEVMDALTKTGGSEQIEDRAKRHRCCGWCAIRLEGYAHRHDMSQSAESIVKDIKSMVDECPKGPDVTRLKRADELESISNDFMEGLESREELIEKILIALNDDQVNAVGVYGMGGSGKTTLATEVASKRASDLFDKRLVIKISEAPDIKGIQDQVAEGINLPLDGVHSIAQRASKIYNGLISVKKILIVLDNMWGKLNLEEVGIPRQRSKDFCCKLLITTREEEVCRVMDVQKDNIFKLGMLNDKEAINLFEKKSAKKINSGEYKPVAERLLRKCGGLPLAIVATASALRGKDLSIWCQFAEESEKPISSQVRSEYLETYSILETSYKLMDIEEKRMFFFLACLSPLDTGISVDELMRYGIGLDLFQYLNNISEAMKQALGWANELVSSSLLMNDDTDGQVKIHDVVRASAISFAEKGKGRSTLVESIPRWICKEAFEKLTAISLLSGRDFSVLSGVKAPMLQILLLKGDLSSTTHMSSNFYEGMTNLKVLSLSNMNFNLGLPESMGQLKCLKTLHLHHCHLKDIKTIGKLVNLRVLSLRGSTLKTLAKEIWKLCNLRLLDMGGCKCMTSIPANILSRLSCLEGIYMFDSFDDWASVKTADKKASINELNKLSHLSVLEIEVPRPAQLLTLNDNRLVDQLGKFRIHVGGFEYWYMDKVQGFRYVLGLNDVFKNGNKFLRALLSKTDCLQIRDPKRVIKNFIPQLDEEGFKDLKYLAVEDCYGAECIIKSDKKSMAFGNLQNLKLEEISRLTRICEGKAPAGIFCNLRFLTLVSLPELKYGLPLTCVPLNLVEVSIKDCPSLEFIAYEDEYESYEEAGLVKEEQDLVWLRYLKSVQVSHSKSLSSILGQVENKEDVREADKSFFNSKSKFPSLQILKTSVHEKIVTLWSRGCHVSSFQNLKVLVIFKSGGLLSLGSLSLFAALVQLEELNISECDELQEFITEETKENEIRESVIVFPLLKRLFIEDLCTLKRFYGGSYKLEFPVLKSLIISKTPSLTNFDGSENLTALFSDKIVFPCLEELKVDNVSDKVVRLWNWSSSESESSSRLSLNPVPNLQHLTLGNTHGFMSIPPVVSHNLSHLEFVKFSESKTLFSVSTVNKEASWAYSQVHKLGTLSVAISDSLEILFAKEDDAATIRLCGQLTGITLDNIPNLKLIPLHLLTSIRSLSLSQLSWEYVFSADLFIKDQKQLQLLENLEISYYRNMKVVIKDELADGADRAYVFPRLKSLTLSNSNFSDFARNGSALHFPSLERLKLDCCSEIHFFGSGPFAAPKLKHVELNRCDEMKRILSGNMNGVQELPSLESVIVNLCRELESFSHVPLAAPKLHDVCLSDCYTMEWFSAGDPNNDHVLDLPSLEKVSVSKCPNMRSFSSGSIKAPKLSELEVDDTAFTKHANAELQKILASLSFAKYWDPSFVRP